MIYDQLIAGGFRVFVLLTANLFSTDTRKNTGNHDLNTHVPHYILRSPHMARTPCSAKAILVGDNATTVIAVIEGGHSRVLAPPDASNFICFFRWLVSSERSRSVREESLYFWGKIQASVSTGTSSWNTVSTLTARFTRELVEATGQELYSYRTRQKASLSKAYYYGHAFPNALLPVISMTNVSSNTP